jgi:hypothetical protein
MRLYNRKTHKKQKAKRRHKRLKRTRKLVGGNPMEGKRIFDIYNKFHYGDNILNLKFLFNISDVIKSKNYFIKYYYDENYIKNTAELERYVNKETLSLHPMKDKPDTAIEITMDRVLEGNQHKTGLHDIDSSIDIYDFEKFYDAFYKRILKILEINDASINTSLYQKEDYLETIYNRLNGKYKNIDILIINAEPKSEQYEYKKEKLDDMCIRLNGKYNIVTTNPVNKMGVIIKCTMDDKLMLQDIGAICSHAKYVIAVHSGPIVPCYNEAAKNNVKKWIILVKRDYRFKDVNAVILKSADELMDVEKYLT